MVIFTTVHWLVSQGYSYSLRMPYDIQDHLLYERKISGPVI
jgi:hypothetical protein